MHGYDRMGYIWPNRFEIKPYLWPKDPFPFNISTYLPGLRKVCTPTNEEPCYFFQVIECLPRGVKTCADTWTSINGIGTGNELGTNWGNYNKGDNNRGSYNRGRNNIGFNNTGEGIICNNVIDHRECVYTDLKTAETEEVAVILASPYSASQPSRYPGGGIIAHTLQLRPRDPFIDFSINTIEPSTYTVCEPTKSTACEAVGMIQCLPAGVPECLPNLDGNVGTGNVGRNNVGNDNIGDNNFGYESAGTSGELEITPSLPFAHFSMRTIDPESRATCTPSNTQSCWALSIVECLPAGLQRCTPDANGNIGNRNNGYNNTGRNNHGSNNLGNVNHGNHVIGSNNWGDNIVCNSVDHGGQTQPLTIAIPVRLQSSSKCTLTKSQTCSSKSITSEAESKCFTTASAQSHVAAKPHSTSASACQNTEASLAAAGKESPPVKDKGDPVATQFGLNLT
ncbi:hypothetical protein APUTEX25_002525 [Auxenochlorella protothecoides]|uniref:Uncharacterized protein n=1 Tax=Auxenochlorella protothecoides TaxID=3075 RepID=A0A3M7KTT1_AUXPR|nr:hypothetical protein APUTEX25_002525 [Auxenochlorella protothecoides]|eukprot:RMZ53948.1 hypothetical protein APUTEX25_002525 [Auxenochlorella protothecoides]